MTDPDDLIRYERQMRCHHLGRAGQQALRAARALVVGVGGLGTWTSEILARSGVGMLRLIDDDVVDVNNIHRQGYYTEADTGRPKAEAAAARLREINSSVAVETVVDRLTTANIDEVAAGMDVVLDGCDNFASRFILNDYAVRESVPWVFAGILASEAQTLTIVPGRTPCLRCLYDGPPAPGKERSNAQFGVLPPVVMTVCGIQATEVMKLLAGQAEAISPYLLKFDLWTNALQRIDMSDSADTDCPCCRQRHFEYL